MNHRRPVSQSILHATRRLARRPSARVLGATAATAAAVAGVAVVAAPANAAVAGPSWSNQAMNIRFDVPGLPQPVPFVLPHPNTAPLAQPATQASQAATAKTATAKAATAKPATAKAASATRHPAGHPAAATAKAAAHPVAAKRQANPRRRPTPFLIYDSVTPSAIPQHHVVATYATGGFAVPGSVVAGRKVLWIDTQGTDPAAGALDVEPGDATPSMAATWARQRLSAHPGAHAVIYTMRSEWPATQAAIATLPARMRSHIRWWIADPTGYPHVLAGANATQWYWGHSYDISTAKPGF